MPQWPERARRTEAARHTTSAAFSRRSRPRTTAAPPAHLMHHPRKQSASSPPLAPFAVAGSPESWTPPPMFDHGMCLHLPVSPSAPIASDHRNRSQCGADGQADRAECRACLHLDWMNSDHNPVCHTCRPTACDLEPSGSRWGFRTSWTWLGLLIKPEWHSLRIRTAHRCNDSSRAGH